MNIRLIVSSAAIALALGVSGAVAQTIQGPPDGVNAGEADGDIILGFTNPTTPAAAGDLVFDLGSADNFYSTANGGTLTAGTTYTVAAFNAADVTEVFGSGAFSNANVLYGIIGGNGPAGGPGTEPTETVWAATPGAPLKAQSSQTTVSDSINGFTDSGVGNGLQQADNPDAVTIPTSVGFNKQATAAGNFGAFPTSILGSLPTVSTMELYELIEPTAGTTAGIDLGTFNLSASGLTFTAFEAIPEPSTYAAILGALTIGFVVIRRRMQSTGLSLA
jgi:hypothetical protein